MAHVIHETPSQVVERDTRVIERDSGGTGWVVGVIVAVILAFLFLYYGLPAIRNAGNGVNVQVPEQVDVNVNQPQQ